MTHLHLEQRTVNGRVVLVLVDQHGNALPGQIAIVARGGIEDALTVDVTLALSAQEEPEIMNMTVADDAAVWAEKIARDSL